jgi:hypothetical protein
MTNSKSSEDLIDLKNIFRCLTDEFINILEKNLDEDETSHLKSVEIDIQRRTIRINYKGHPRLISDTYRPDIP